MVSDVRVRPTSISTAAFEQWLRSGGSVSVVALVAITAALWGLAVTSSSVPLLTRVSSCCRRSYRRRLRTAAGLLLLLSVVGGVGALTLLRRLSAGRHRALLRGRLLSWLSSLSAHSSVVLLPGLLVLGHLLK